MCLSTRGGGVWSEIFGGVSGLKFSGGCLVWNFRGGVWNFFFLFFPISFPPQKNPAGMHTHPPPRRSMRGRYASYWNAFLFYRILQNLWNPVNPCKNPITWPGAGVNYRGSWICCTGPILQIVWLVRNYITPWVIGCSFWMYFTFWVRIGYWGIWWKVKGFFSVVQMCRITQCNLLNINSPIPSLVYVMNTPRTLFGQKYVTEK